MSAQAAIISYQFTISGNWFDDLGQPFGMPLSPTLNGTIVVDNTKTGASALVDFSLTTGSQTWTEDDFVGVDAKFLFDGSGALTQFELEPFVAAPGTYLYVNTNNTAGVSDGRASNACNGCVSLGAGTTVNNVPEPATTALLGLGLLGFAFLRRMS